MPDRDYNINFTAPSDAAIASLDALIQRLQMLDRLCDSVKPKLASLATGASRGINSTAKAAEGLATSLNSVNTASGQVSGSLGQVSAQSLHVTNSAKTLKTHSEHATGAFGEWASKGLHLNATLLRVAYAGAAIGGVVGIAHGLAKAYEDAEKFAEECATKSLKLRDAVRELKAITGDKTTEETTAKVTDTMAKSGMKQDEAIAFNMMWPAALNAAQKSGNWKLDDKDTEKVRIEAARFAVTNGVSPETMGRLVPMIGAAQPVKTADEVLSQLAGMQHFGAEAVGKFTPLMKDALKQQGSLVKSEGGGAFRNMTELMGGISATTGAGVPEARVPTTMAQVWRELSSPKTPKALANLKRIGIEPGKTDYVTDIEKIGDYLDSTRAKGMDDNLALRDLGLKAASANASIIQSVKARKTFRANQDEAGAVADPAAVRKANEEFHRNNPDRFADAAQAAGELERGKEMEGLLPLRKFAKAGLTRRGIEGSRIINMIDTFYGASRWARMMPGASEARYDTIIREKIKQNVPDAMRRFPSLATDWKGEGGAEDDKLADILKQLSPAEREKVTTDLEKWSLTKGPASQRGPATSKPVMATPPPKGTPAAGGGAAASIGGTVDGGLASLNAAQLRVLQSIDRKLDGGGVGDLGIDGGDNGPLRS